MEKVFSVDIFETTNHWTLYLTYFSQTQLSLISYRLSVLNIKVIILYCMAYVQQVCEGYNKKALMGNWYEERLYPQQPFRENITKAPRTKEQAMTTLDGRGFQRALPRIERRSKWETANRIILDDGIKPDVTVQRAEFPHNQQQSSTKQMKRPFDKNFSNVQPTSIHPHSQNKPAQKHYHFDSTQANQARDVRMYGSDFKSSLPQHPQVQKFTNYISQMKGKYPEQELPARSRTQSEFNKNQLPAGNHRQVTLEQTVKPITTMFCQNVKLQGDQKQKTSTQRSWVPQKDKAISYSQGRTAQQFKNQGIPKNDIQTSLNMNTGMHNLHPVGVPDNFFRHVRSVTVKQNNTFCNRP